MEIWHQDFRDESERGLQARCLHLLEMGAKVGGNPKKKEFFEQVLLNLEKGQQWKLYFGEINCEIAGALLLFYWREYVEYITPVTVSKFSNQQPGSALIFEAMFDAVKDGYQLWNFGGTWPTQNGVKDFKKSWGTESRNYKYHIIDFGGLSDLQKIDTKTLMQEYDGFYIYPF